MPTNYENVKAWRKENKDKVNAQARRYRATHPDKVKIVKDRYRSKDVPERLKREAQQARRRRANDPEGQRRRMEAYKLRREAKLTQIAGRPRAEVCELCKEFGPTKFDHCHFGGHFRGWICDRCNRTLGQVKDSVSLLRDMIEYLERNNGKTHIQGS